MSKRDEEKMVLRHQEILATAEQVGEITTPVKYETTSNLLAMTKDLAKEIKVYFAPMKTKAKDAHSEICSKEKAALAPVQTALTMITGRLDHYDERVRREAKEEAERVRKEEEDAALERAAKMEEHGLPEEAERVLATHTPVFTPPPEPPKTEQMSTRTTWDFEILDPMQITAAFMMPDEVKIRKIVKAHKEKALEMIGPGGIRVFEKTIRTRRR